MKQVELEILCPVCNGNSAHHINVEDWGEMRRCKNCGLIFAQPLLLPQDPKQFFTEAYSGQVSIHGMEEFSRRLADLPDYSDSSSPGSKLDPTRKMALDWIKRNISEGSTILDIGCGRGDFLHALKDAGFNALGVDPGEPVVQLLKKEGFTVWHGTANEIPRISPEPDLCTSFLVIHHSPDPIGFLDSIRKQFPRSMLLISDCSDWRNYSRRPPRHFTVWSHKSMQIALDKAGYDAEVKTSELHSITGFPGGGLLLKLRLRKLYLALRSIYIYVSILYRKLTHRSEIILAVARPRYMQ